MANEDQDRQRTESSFPEEQPGKETRWEKKEVMPKSKRRRTRKKVTNADPSLGCGG